MGFITDNTFKPCPFVCNRQYGADRSCIKCLDGANPIFNTAASITKQMVFATRFVVFCLHIIAQTGIQTVRMTNGDLQQRYCRCKQHHEFLNRQIHFVFLGSKRLWQCESRLPLSMLSHCFIAVSIPLMTVISLYGWGGVTRMIAVWPDIGEIDH
ncbi:Uncharacterised protein [Neisseria gonorrhoeae]|nr:Uncharacterised protein [Neisseria gonorrhoeae]